jgi:hypothetical protein
MATKNTLEENLDEELANYLLSLSDDEESVCGRDQVISDSDDSDIVIKRKKPRLIDDSDHDDVCSDEAYSMRPLEFSLVDENCDNCCPTNFSYAEIWGPKHVLSPNAGPLITSIYFSLIHYGIYLYWKQTGMLNSSQLPMKICRQDRE